MIGHKTSAPHEAARLGGVSLAVLCAIWLRWTGLSPQSLWLDDLWELALARSDLTTTITLASHSPIGQRLLLRWSSELAGIELGAQLPAFIFGLGAIVLIALAGRAATADRADVLATIVPAWLLATSAIGADYSLRAKPYLADLALTAVMLFLVASWREPSRRRLQVWLCFGALALFLGASVSFAILAGAIVLGWSWRTRKVLAAGLVTGTVLELGIWWALQIRPAHGIALTSYWEQYYPSLTTLPAALVSTLSQWLEDLLHLGVWSLPLGLVMIATWLYRDRRSRVVQVSVMLFAGLMLAAVLGLYPLGSGRVDLLLSAPLALGIGRGLALISSERPLRLQLVVVVALGLGLALSATRASYPRQDAKQTVERLGECRAEVIGGNHSAAFALAVYGDGASEIRRSDLLSCGFSAVWKPSGSTWIKLDEGLVQDDVVDLDALILVGIDPQESENLDRLLLRHRGRAEISLIGPGAAMWCW